MSEIWPRDEEARLQVLHALDILDTPPEDSFDRFARLARGLFDAPIGTVSLIDRDRQFLKAALGCELGSMPRGESICTWTVAQDTPLVIPDLTEDPRFATNPRVIGGPCFRFYAGAPLRTRDGHNLGAVCCLDVRPRRVAGARVALLQDLAQLVVEAMDLRAVATTDSLTGAMTRRAFLEAARRDIQLAQRGRRPLACLMLDVDHFKQVNDTYGHATGDDVLRRIAFLCRQNLRASDYCGRLGGEEFAIILRDTSAADAFEVAERLRQSIAFDCFEVRGRPWRVTASLGLAILSRNRDVEALIAAADAALYAAKGGGRNQTICADGMAVPRLAIAS